MRSTRRVAAERSEFAGFRFPPEVITLAVRWYVRYSLSYRDVEEPLAERGIEVDHTTLFRWVMRFTPLFTEAARPLRHTPGDRWFGDETYVKVAGKWRYLYRAIDQFGQVIDLLVAPKRDKKAAGGSSPGRSSATPRRRSDHRSGTRLPAHSRGPAARRSARHRALREEPGRG